MDVTAETYRVKVHRDESPSRPHRASKKESSCLAGCRNVKKKPRKRSKCYRKSKPSLDTIRKSTSANCCACCCVLAQYIKEACKLICSCLNERPTETRICELFAELLEVSWCLGVDCCNFVKYLFRLLCVYKE